MTREHILARHGTEFFRSRSLPTLDRRRLIGVAAGLGAAVAIPRALTGATLPASTQGPAVTSPPGGYTWLLDSPSALQPEAPGDPTATEIDELLAFQTERTDEMLATIDSWAGQPAVFPWLELGMRLTAENLRPGLFEMRAQSLVRTAMNDAVVAALDAQQAIARPAPAVSDERIESIGSDPVSGFSFPSLHAAVAGAASTVLAYLFPDASDDGFAGMANEAAASRLWAGAAYRSDIDAGLALGQTVGALAVQHGSSDGSDAVWDGTGWPTGDGLYEATPPNYADPFEPLAGTWVTWVLPSGDALRPAAYPAYGSPAWNAELSAVQRACADRTLEQERIIDYWLSIGPNAFYTSYAQDLIQRHALGEAEAASVLAMVSIAMYDGVVATWDGKFHFWIARPFTNDPELNLYIPNPPYPSYPAGFPNGCGAGAAVLADVFPSAATDLYATAWEGATQRHWSGIHYLLDNEVGVQMGSQAGRITVATVRGVGTTPSG